MVSATFKQHSNFVIIPQEELLISEPANRIRYNLAFILVVQHY